MGGEGEAVAEEVGFAVAATPQQRVDQHEPHYFCNPVRTLKVTFSASMAKRTSALASLDHRVGRSGVNGGMPGSCRHAQRAREVSHEWGHVLMIHWTARQHEARAVRVVVYC